MTAVRTVLLSLCGILFVLLPPANGQFIDQVGELGDLKKLEIRGSTTFTPDDIRDPLWRSLDVQMAAHSKSFLRDYLATLEDKVSEGYRHAGFWDVRVTAEVDRRTARPVLTVVEGPRLTTGVIRVEGAKSIPVADLVRRLTSRRPKQAQGSDPQGLAVKNIEGVGKATRELGKSEETDPPVWEQGKPAHLDREAKKAREQDIKDAFADLGFMSARFFNDVIRDPQGNTVSLVIKIHDEGVQTVLDRIDIAGNEKNSREEIIEYLGLKPGMPLCRGMCAVWKERLRMSGRFTKCEVELMPPLFRSEKQGLVIDLSEYSKAPRLGEPLSPAEQALLKCRHHLMNSANWPGDLVCRVPSRGACFVISSKHGSLLTMYEPAGAAKTPKLHHAFAASIAEVGFYNIATGRKYAFLPNGKPVVLSLCMIYESDPKAVQDDQPFRMMFGFGINSDEKKGKQLPLWLDLKMEPVVFLALAHEHKPKTTIAGDVITLKSAGIDIWRINTKSGQLLEWSLLGKEGNEKEESPKITAAFEKGEFDRQFAELRKSVADHANMFDPKQPFASAGKFFASDDAYWPKLAAELYGSSDKAKKIGPEARRILCKLFAGGILRPLDAIDWNNGRDEDTEFKLCEDSGFAKHGFVGVAAQIALSASDSVFPRDSWPWTLTRETALSIVGKGQHSREEMFDLYSSADSGPICCLVAGTLNLWNDPPMARKFAEKGLKKLDVKDFRKDYGFLLRPDHPIAKHVDEFMAALSELDDDDVAYLVRKSKPKDAKYVAEGFRILRQRKGRPAIESLPDVLDAIWQNGLRDRVKTALECLASGAPPWASNGVAANRF